LTEFGNRSKLKRAGANPIVITNKTGGDYLASLLMVSDLICFIKELSWLEYDSLNHEEISIDAPPKNTTKNLCLSLIFL
tara:strand:+ start:171 stop:407 length:237 start_codon:yes stop_codon:yes gene_type:complete